MNYGIKTIAPTKERKDADMLEILKPDEILGSPAFKAVIDGGISQLETDIMKAHREEEVPEIITYLEALRIYTLEDRRIPLVRKDDKGKQNTAAESDQDKHETDKPKANENQKIIYVQSGTDTHTDKNGKKVIPLYNEKGEPREDVRQLVINTDPNDKKVTVSLEQLKMSSLTNKPRSKTIIGLEIIPLYQDRFILSYIADPHGDLMRSQRRSVIEPGIETATAFKSLMFKKKNKKE